MRLIWRSANSASFSCVRPRRRRSRRTTCPSASRRSMTPRFPCGKSLWHDLAIPHKILCARMRDDLLLLRTDLQDQHKPDLRCRGSRYWTQAELNAQMFFIVAGREKDSMLPNPRRFITADVSEVLRISQQHGLEQWSVAACLPGWDCAGRIERVVEFYVGAGTHQFAVKLQSGEVIWATGTTGSQTISRGSVINAGPDSGSPTI